MSHHDTNPKHPPVLLETVTSSLLWPSALRCASMAFEPSRWGLGIACVLVFRGLVALSNALDVPSAARLHGTVSAGVESVLAVALSLRVDAIGDVTRRALAEPVWEALRQNPVESVLSALVFLLVWSVFAGALARSAAVQIATGVTMPALRSLRFGVTGLRAVFASFLTPLVLASILAFAVWGLASAAPSMPLLAFVPALVMVAALALHGVSFALIPPAVACERTDAIDALQRCGAYLLTRPLRAVLYAGIALGVCLLAHAVLSFVVFGAVNITDSLTGDGGAADPGAVWVRTAALITEGYAVSAIATASTVVYLLLRRVCDEQDVRDIALDGPVRRRPATEVG